MEPSPTRDLHIIVSPPSFTGWRELLVLLHETYAYMEGRIDPPSSLLRMDAQDLELETRLELVENHSAFGALGFSETARKSHPGYARATSITMPRPVSA